MHTQTHRTLIYSLIQSKYCWKDIAWIWQSGNKRDECNKTEPKIKTKIERNMQAGMLRQRWEMKVQRNLFKTFFFHSFPTSFSFHFTLLHPVLVLLLSNFLAICYMKTEYMCKLCSLLLGKAFVFRANKKNTVHDWIEVLHLSCSNIVRCI